MSATPNVQLFTDAVYQYVLSVRAGGTEFTQVKLRDGGVLITSADGDHVQVLVQSVHFLPGQELPF